MLKKFKVPVLTGLSFYGIAYGVVKFSGFNSASFTVISYLYIALGLILGAYYELQNHDGLGGFLHNLVVVVEGEEMELKKIFTGEKYRLKGEIEKIG